VVEEYRKASCVSGKYGTIYSDGIWNLDAPNITGPNDIDDICAPGEGIAWMVQNVGGESSGNIIRVRMVDGKPVSDVMNPVHGYVYEGVSCFNEKDVWVVGHKAISAPASLPTGVILHTVDGGETWTSQQVSANDVDIWKVSFAGARR